MYSKPGIEEIINIQAAKDGKSAKIYQVKQVLGIIENYKIVIR